MVWLFHVMAKMYPPNITPSAPSSERKVWDRLQEIDGIIVFHSLTWQGKRGKGKSDGEADFVILFPGKGVIVIEVKGGEISIEEGTWKTVDRHRVKHDIKDPFNQAKDSKFALLSFLRKHNVNTLKVPIVHAVIFPDITINDQLAINAPAELIIDRAGLQRLQNRLIEVFKYWQTKSGATLEQCNEIASLLAPSRNIKRLLSDRLKQCEEEIIELTKQQYTILYSLQKSNKAMIYGSAGTGKTILAVEKAKQLSSIGFKVLFLCYNELLANQLANQITQHNISIFTYHKLLSLICRENGSKLYLPNDEELADFAIEQFTNQQGSKHLYDAIIIDEVQDFRMDWLESVNLLVEDNYTTYYFGDSNQELYDRYWKCPQGFTEFVLSTNCRNTKQIGTFVSKILGNEVLYRPVEGPDPSFITVKRKSDFLPFTCNLLESLIEDECLEPEDITILCDERWLIEELRQHIICDYSIGNIGCNGIQSETIRRFKGLESNFIILVLTQNAVEKPALTYVGASRAKAGLYVLGCQKTISSFKSL